jgi:hypothetical protein
MRRTAARSPLRELLDQLWADLITRAIVLAT